MISRLASSFIGYIQSKVFFGSNYMNNFVANTFISYCRADKLEVKKLYHQLNNDGFSVWFDEEKLLPGQDWSLEIENNLRRATTVILCLSSNSVTREGYVQKELKLALNVAQEKPEGTIYIIPVRLDSCDVPKSLQKYHWVDLFESNGYERIKQALITRIERYEKQIEIPVIKPSVNEQPVNITIIIEKNIVEFTETEKDSFLFAISRLTGVSKNQIRVLQVAEGSVILTIEMPSFAAEKLLGMYTENDLRLQNFGITEIFFTDEIETTLALSNRLGLNFRNYSILQRAFTHSSYADENIDFIDDNGRLEFLGDSILECIVGAWAYRRFPEMTEGDLTKIRSAILRNEQLALFSRRLRLWRALLIGKVGFSSNERLTNTVLGSIFEALVGALYLDAGLRAAEEFITPLLDQSVDNMIPMLLDPKTQLQELLKSKKMGLPNYTVFSSRGSSGSYVFEVVVEIENGLKGKGIGHSKYDAERNAAQDIIRIITNY